MNQTKPNTLAIGDYDGENTGFSGMKKILILAANPKTTPNLRLSEEVREIEKIVKSSEHRKRFQLEIKWAVRHMDFQDALLDYKPHIVHFIGHGEEDGVWVEDEFGLPILYPTDALSKLFGLCSKYVECVLLGACYSSTQADIIHQYIDHVIGMERAIADKTAIVFSVAFYSALVKGCSTKEAFEFGKLAVSAKPNKLPDHPIPILKIRSMPEPTPKKMVKINLHLETTGDTFEVNVALDANTAAVKKYVINALKLPKTFEDGFLIPYQLLSKTRDAILNDEKTLRENGVFPDEVFVFLIEVDA